MRLTTRHGWRWNIVQSLIWYLCPALVCVSVILNAPQWGAWLHSGPSLRAVAGLRLPLTIPLVLAIAGTFAVIFAYAFIEQALQTTARTIREARIRYRAARGDPAAMPLAYTMPLPDDFPDVSYTPLRGLYSTFPTTHTVYADDRGVHQHGVLSGERLMRWEDARLLEVVPQPGNQRLIYVLRGRGRPVSWGDRRAGGSAESRLAYQRLHAQMLAVVHARTGLLPRTLDPALQPTHATPATDAITVTSVATASPRPLTLRDIPYYVLLLAFIAALALAAYASIALPLTSVLAANIYAAANVGILALVLLGALLWGTTRRLGLFATRHPTTREPPPLPAAPTAGHYTLVWRHSRWNQLGALAIGVALVANAVPWGLAMVTARGDLAPAIYASSVPLVILIILGGYAVLTDGLRTRRFTLSANQDGMTSGSQTIPWEQVSALRWSAKQGTGAFTVVGAMRGQTITWPTRPARLITRPSADAQPITPMELAALVAAHSGMHSEVE